MKYDCLIIDDEKMLADSTAEYFNLFGVKAAAVYSASQCRDFLKDNQAGLLLLDINLGDGSGFELCQELREKEIPILFISARTSDDDKIIALNIGGDDYIQKPCSLGVLLAKVKVVLKRFGPRPDADRYSDGRLTVDFMAKQVFVEGKPVKLTALEFKLLSCLIKNENKVLSKQELFEEVWEDRFTGDGTLNVHIRKIREAIERDPGKPEYIRTVWGDGYRFCGEMQ